MLVRGVVPSLAFALPETVLHTKTKIIFWKTNVPLLLTHHSPHNDPRSRMATRVSVLSVRASACRFGVRTRKYHTAIFASKPRLRGALSCSLLLMSNAMSGSASQAIEVDVVVVGAGISGLTAASKLHAAGFSVRVLEARERVGGRCFSTPEGADLGGSWAWLPDESHVSNLATDLGLVWVPMRLDGGVRLPGGKRQSGGGEYLAPCGPGAVRMDGGYAALAEALAKTLPEGSIKTNVDVRSIKKSTNGVEVVSSDLTLSVRRVVVAIPPRVLAARVHFEPGLPPEQLAQMRGTATWAGDWCKVVASFKSNFWRKNGDAGVAKFGGNSLLAVTWEAADPDDLGEKGACLAGVNFGEGACARLAKFGEHADTKTGKSNQALTEAVTKELSGVFGEDVIRDQILAVYHTAWTGEKYTWHEGDGGALGRGDDPRRLYGHPNLKKPTNWGVHFAGTETEPKSGHVDGAVAAGERVFLEIKQALGAPGGGKADL